MPQHVHDRADTNWRDEQSASERYRKAPRQAARATELDSLCAAAPSRRAPDARRRAIGEKLVEWFKHLRKTSHDTARTLPRGSN